MVGIRIGARGGGTRRLDFLKVTFLKLVCLGLERLSNMFDLLLVHPCLPLSVGEEIRSAQNEDGEPMKITSVLIVLSLAL